MSMAIPLISSLFPNLNLTEFSKTFHVKKVEKDNLTTISKVDIETSVDTGNTITLNPPIEEKPDFKPKFYINKNIIDMKGSGGVEAFKYLSWKDRIIRLSISPSQGDDPGFKSRPEHFKSIIE
jgi:hypothetical protein